MTEHESPDWRLGTFQGLRQSQHEAFRKLSFREKVKRLEDMAQVAAALTSHVNAESLPKSRADKANS